MDTVRYTSTPVKCSKCRKACLNLRGEYVVASDCEHGSFCFDCEGTCKCFGWAGYNEEIGGHDEIQTI